MKTTFKYFAVMLFLLLSQVSRGLAQSSPVLKQDEKRGVIDVTIDGQLFTTYHYADDFIKPYVRPFFWPVKVADGTEVTIDQAQDPTLHPYQRSVWVGNGDVNGADHWKFNGKPSPPKQRNIKFDKIEGDTFVQELAWEDKNGQPMLNERRTVRFINYPDSSRGIDITLAFSPISQDVVFGDSKDHGLFSVRPLPSISHDPTLFNSAGATGNDCSDGTADWCDESGKINGKTYGIAMLADPANFVHPEMWHAHSDARLAADPLARVIPPNKKPHKGDGIFTVKLNTTATFHYCAIFHAGELTPTEIALRYAAFAGIKPVSPPVLRPQASDVVTPPTTAPAAPAAEAPADNPPVTVDGVGEFKTVQAAIDSIPLDNDHLRIISIKPGRYYEKLMVKAPFVHLVGSDAATTILTYDDWALKIGANGRPIGTNASHTLFVYGHDFEADNLTIENTKVPRRVVKQTMAVGVQADRVIFKHCRFLGHQDTLLAGTGRQYYTGCTIVGDGDFIFGDAAAVFDHCEIRSNGAGVVTAQERTSADSTTGYVFTHCNFTSTPDVAAAKVYLGKPFRPYARVILLNCDLGNHINPAGWVTITERDDSKTAFFAESASTGEGAASGKRVPWARQLSDADLQAFNPAVFLSGSDGWKLPGDKDPQR